MGMSNYWARITQNSNVIPLIIRIMQREQCPSLGRPSHFPELKLHAFLRMVGVMEKEIRRSVEVHEWPQQVLGHPQAEREAAAQALRDLFPRPALG
jgi:hypothetical protein